MSKRRYGDYRHVSADVISEACRGNGEAMNQVIVHFQNYGRTCFRSIASTVFNLDVRCIPMEDLMQLVWIRFMRVIVEKFDTAGV